MVCIDEQELLNLSDVRFWILFFTETFIKNHKEIDVHLYWQFMLIIKIFSLDDSSNSKY